jgi:hypothetical protein
VKDSRITQANCDRIQLGWTPEQVVELLGPHYLPKGPWDALGLGWEDDEGNFILVTFDKRGVILKNFEPTTLTFFEKITRRFKRRSEVVWPAALY